MISLRRKKAISKNKYFNRLKFKYFNRDYRSTTTDLQPSKLQKRIKPKKSTKKQKNL